MGYIRPLLDISRIVHACARAQFASTRLHAFKLHNLLLKTKKLENQTPPQRKMRLIKRKGELDVLKRGLAFNDISAHQFLREKNYCVGPY